MELGAGGSRQLGDAALDRSVDVLVGRRELEAAVLQLGRDPVERGQHDLGLVAIQDPGSGQPADVGSRPGYVVGREALVDWQAHSEGEQLVGRRTGEAPLIQGHCDAPGPWMPDHVSTPRPHRRTNPAESSWRKLSAAS